MRPLIIISMLALGLAAISARVQSLKLDGAWIPVKQEMAGMNLDPKSFAAEKLVIADSTYTLTAESVDKGIARYADGKMDIYGRVGVNAGKHFTAIYKFVNDTLSICYNLSGKSYPADYATKGKPGFFLSVFKRSE